MAFLACPTNFQGYWSHVCFISVLKINVQVYSIIQIETEKFTSFVFENKIILARFWGAGVGKCVDPSESNEFFSLTEKNYLKNTPPIKRGETNSSLKRSLINQKVRTSNKVIICNLSVSSGNNTVKTCHSIQNITVYLSGGEMTSKWTRDPPPKKMNKRRNSDMIISLLILISPCFWWSFNPEVLSFATQQASEFLLSALLWNVLRECKLILILA